MRVVTENTYKCQKCSLHLGLQCNVLLPFCALVHKESHRSHTGPEVLQTGRVGQAGPTQENVWRIKQPRMKSPVKRATSTLVLAYNTKHAAPSETASHGERWHLLHFHLKLLMVPTGRKRSVGPFPGYSVVVLGSSSQKAQRAQVAGGIFSLGFFTSTSSWRPGEKLWTNLHRCNWKDPCINGRHCAGTVGCNGEVPRRPVEEVTMEVLGATYLEGGIEKTWINTVLFGSGHMGLAGWVHRDPPGFGSLLRTIFPAQEHRGEAGLGLRTTVKD